MGTKIKYTIKFLLGILFVVGIALFGYWLLAIYKVENVVGQIAIGIFIIIPLLKTIFTLPGELRILGLVWSSDIPEEIEDVAAYLRERDRL